MQASLRIRWIRSLFHGATDQQILQSTFTYACGNVTGGSQLSKLQEAAATLVPGEEGSSEVPMGTLDAFRKVVIDVMVEANIAPPAQYQREEADAEMEGRSLRTNGLSLRDPHVYIKQIVAERKNTVAAHNAAADGSDSEAEEDKNVTKKVAKGGKKKVVPLHETMQQLPQAMGASYDVLGERRVDFMTEKQLLRLLNMVAEVRYIPRVERDSGLIQLLQKWALPEPRIATVRKQIADTKPDMKIDRKEANLLIMVADVLRRSAAAHSNKGEVQSSELLEMEQLAAIATQLGVYKLQKGAQKQTKAFCGTFGIAQTPDIEQLVTDPAMMDSDKQAEVQTRLAAAFELKRSFAQLSGQLATPEPQGVCHGGFGTDCWDLQRGRPCGHSRGHKRAKGGGGGRWDGGKGKGKGKGKGGRW